MYFVFSGLSYYADGGWRDFVASVDTIESARKVAGDHFAKLERREWVNYPWYQIVDSQSLEICESAQWNGATMETDPPPQRTKP